MQTEKNKVLLRLKGKPLFLHSLTAFAASGVISEAVIVCRPEEEDDVKTKLNDLPFPLRFGIWRRTPAGFGLSRSLCFKP